VHGCHPEKKRCKTAKGEKRKTSAKTRIPKPCNFSKKKKKNLLHKIKESPISQNINGISVIVKGFLGIF
jgi:hypothetical protein